MKRLLLLAAAPTAAVSLILVGAVGVGLTPPVAAACGTGTVPVTTTTGLAGMDAAATVNAGTVITVGTARKVPRLGLIVALIVARQESGFHNLANATVPESLLFPHEGVGHDHDSVGVFQQRPSWGPVATRMDVAASAGLFYDRLTAVPHWMTLPVNDAAQAVQRSGTPEAYGRWETLATQILAATTGTVPPTCGPAVTTTVPGAAGVAIAHAELALGTLYQFAGRCDDPHSADMSHHCDCSSLTATAWEAAGVPLPHNSELQWKSPLVHLIPGVTFANLLQYAQPGDLIFSYEGEDGIPGPGHVALYIGGGQLIEAPKPGSVVHIVPVYAEQFMALGRVGT